MDRFCLGSQKNKQGDLGFCVNLAGEGAEVIWVLKTSVTRAADVPGASELPCLRPLI